MKKLSPRILIALLQAANGKPLKFTCSTITILFAGCAVVDTHQAKLDQRELRKILMDYTEDQILDNLVRAYNGHPIVHFDFARVNAGVTSKFSPTASSGRSIQDVRTHTPTHTQNTIPTPGPGAFSTVISVVGGTVETVMKPFSYGISSEHGNTIGLDVKPVLDDRSVYAAYVNFLNCDHDVTPTCDIAEQGATKPINKVAKKESQPAKATKTTTVEKWKEPWKDTPSPAPAVAGPVAEKTTEITETGSTTSTETETGRRKPIDLKVNYGEIVSLHVGAPKDPRDVLIARTASDGQYYWISTEYKQEFFELCLATVARGKIESGAGAVAEELQDIRSEQQQREELR